MKEIMYLDDLEQVKALAMPVRVEILRVMDGRPMTTTQLSKLMSEKPNRLYYHITEMERVGILEIHETRVKGNLVEKYYIQAAHFYRINPLIFQRGEAGREAFLGTVSSQFDSTVLDIRRHMSDGTLDSELIAKSVSSVIETKLTEEQARALSTELRDLVMRHGTAGGEGPLTMHCLSVFYLTRTPDQAGPPED